MADKFLKLKRALFDKCYASLNEKQREAIYTVNNPLLVLAGAGSGKTTVLVKRIVHIIKYGNGYYSDIVPEFADDRYIAEMEEALRADGIDAACLRIEGAPPAMISSFCFFHLAI